MLRAYADARNRCYVHHHRQATKTCERCKARLCDDCTATYAGKTLCANCIGEVQAAEAEKLTGRDRLNLFLRSVRNTLILVAILSILAVPVYFLFLRPMMNQKITPEEWARFRYAAAGSFQTPNGVDVNSTVLGAKIVSATSQQPGYRAEHVINEYTLPNYPGWRSTNASFPQDIVVETSQLASVSKVILTNQRNEPPNTWVNEFEVLVSTEGPTKGFHVVGRWQLAPNAQSQDFTFAKTPAHWIMIRILSNHGSTAYTSLDEFDAFVVPAPQPGAPVARP